MTTLPPGDWRLTVYGSRGTAVGDVRRQPRKADRQRVIADQSNSCLYCGIPIGTVIGRRVGVSRWSSRDTEVTLRPNWDHFVPYSWILRNPRSNWVLACHVCNHIKKGRLFDTVEEARQAILADREERGYESVRQVLARIAAA